jgi:predicted nucleotidyltransferase
MELQVGRIGRIDVLFVIFKAMDALPEITRTLKALKPELARCFGVDAIGLFGSVVRNDFTPQSDVDVVVSFLRPIGIGFVDLAEQLERSLNRKVDLVSRKGIREEYWNAIEKEVVYV